MTIEITLTQGQIAIVDEIDADLAHMNWYANRSRYCFYATRSFRISGRKTTVKEKMHRLILERKLGRHLLKSEVCDHINGNSLDNRRENLRQANNAQNTRNARLRKDNKSGFKGVHKYPGGMWRSIIRLNGKCVHLGYFDTPEEAAEAYKSAAKELFGEYARFK